MVSCIKYTRGLVILIRKIVGTYTGILLYLQFKKDDGWYTWIDYTVFHQLVSFGILCISSSFDLIEHHSCQTLALEAV